ncbi:MAG: alginate export family protein [Sphingomonas bacterium]|nr:alginate export family protein [Sphingomonas bacterium]
MASAAAGMLLVAGSGVAQDATPKASAIPNRPNPAASNRGLFDDGRVEQKAGEEAKKLRIAARVTLEAQHLDNFDLDDDEASNVSRIAPELRVELTYEPDDDFLAFLSLEIGDTFERRQGAGWNSREKIEVREAFLHFKDVIEDVEVQVGRQRFKDRRQWLYDERLDALRFVYDDHRLTVEAAVARLGLAPIDLLHPKRRARTDNFILRAEYELTRDWDIAAYTLIQNDRTADDESPIFFGVQSDGKIIGGLSHWLELSLQRGHDNDRKLRGNAVDAGLIYGFEAWLKPAMFVGFARGSGGRDGRIDRNFRQTGLQDNEDRITGLANVRYYGELLDPDLSNLAIFTAGAGIRPSDASSLEIVWHKYRQVRLSEDGIRGSPMDVKPEGVHRNLGHEIDVIGAIRLADHLGLEAKLGYFNPGKAFDNDTRDHAFFAKTRLVYRF